MKYLVAWPRHGLGDRLKLTSSAWAAADTYERVFVIRWLPPIGCDANWEELFKPTTGWIIGDECYEGNNHKQLFDSGRIRRFRHKEVDDIEDSDHKWIEVCAGYFCGQWNNKEVLHPYLVKLVSPLDRIQEHIDDTLLRFSKNTIGVHLRKVFGGSLEKTISFLDEGVEEYDKIFFCTDTPEFSEHMKKRYGKKVVMFDQKNKNRSVDGMQEALVDFVLLSRCVKIVGTKDSSFSQMSWMLSSMDTEGVFI
jgi:hypothetical protein